MEIQELQELEEAFKLTLKFKNYKRAYGIAMETMLYLPSILETLKEKTQP